LLKAGWISDFWEDPPPDDRPKKRFYEITSTGREQYADALREHEQRRAGWLRPAPQTGSAS
jgi:DNA-binding PadR family transcriptional regulator